MRYGKRYLECSSVIILIPIGSFQVTRVVDTIIEQGSSNYFSGKNNSGAALIGSFTVVRTREKVYIFYRVFVDFFRRCVCSVMLVVYESMHMVYYYHTKRIF